MSNSRIQGNVYWILSKAGLMRSWMTANRSSNGSNSVFRKATLTARVLGKKVWRERYVDDSKHRQCFHVGAAWRPYVGGYYLNP